MKLSLRGFLLADGIKRAHESRNDLIADNSEPTNRRDKQTNKLTEQDVLRRQSGELIGFRLVEDLTVENPTQNINLLELLFGFFENLKTGELVRVRKNRRDWTSHHFFGNFFQAGIFRRKPHQSFLRDNHARITLTQFRTQVLDVGDRDASVSRESD